MPLSVDSQRVKSIGRRGFTLVELLVVIGIIALLIAILLPALAGARRAANQAKCAAALKEIGTAFNLYANENQGWWPPSSMDPTSAGFPNGYSIGNDTFGGPSSTTGSNPTTAYWYNFISSYVDASKMGNAATTAYSQGQSVQRNVLWGCPAFQPYINPASGGITVTGGFVGVQTGYGMNLFPLFSDVNTAYNPTGAGIGTEDGTQENSIRSFAAGQWFRQVQYTESAARLLVGDALYWAAETLYVAPKAPGQSFPQNIVAQPATGDGATFNSAGQTAVDIFRHGSVPAFNGGTYSSTGGRVSYNMLFCDGHVGESNMAQDAYLAARRHFPR